MRYSIQEIVTLGKVKKKDNQMKLRCGQSVNTTLKAVLWMLAAGMVIPFSASGEGALRITMTDGTSVQVSSFWEKGNEIRFDIPGGVAGIPKAQVASIQEIISAREFDPEVILEAKENTSSVERDKMLQSLLDSTAEGAGGEQMDPKEGRKLLEGKGVKAEATRQAGEFVLPVFTTEKESARLVQNGEELNLELRKVLSSQVDLRKYSFTMTLYDDSGNILQQKPCELIERDVDKKTLRKLNIRGRLFDVVVMVKPDIQIKRYEITAAKR